MRRHLFISAGAGAFLALGAAGTAFSGIMTERPRTDRQWAPDQAILPAVENRGDRLVVSNVRDFQHVATGDPDGTGPVPSPDPAYRTETIDLAHVRSVWMALAPFAERWRGLAHAFVSFELEGGRFLAVSVEARRERDEPYTLRGGLTRQLELMYVVGTEADLIGLRALRGDTLYLYRTRADPEQARALLVDMLERAEDLRHAPEFYNTLTHNCVTTLRDHVNRVVEGALPWGWGVLLPGFSDEMALKHGLLDTDLPIEAAREQFRVDEQARQALATPGGRGRFSELIRAGDQGDPSR